MRRLAVLFLLAGIALSSLHAQVQEHRIFLNRGVFYLLDGSPLPALAFNDDTIYRAQNKIFSAPPGSTLRITLHNRDTTLHGVEYQSNLMATVPAGDSATFDIIVPAEGTAILHDPVDFPRNKYLGAACLVASESTSADGRFYWNIHEFQVAATQAMINGLPFDWNQFNPDYFVANGNWYPNTELDPAAWITGFVGDTLIIHVANTGAAKHALHFHGYHFRVLHSSKSTVHKDWIKDSMPIDPMQTLTLELIPDKPGMYPVHDHNLLSLKGGGTYPFGLMMMISIQ